MNDVGPPTKQKAAAATHAVEVRECRESFDRDEAAPRLRLLVLCLLCRPTLTLRIGDTLASLGAEHAGLF